MNTGVIDQSADRRRRKPSAAKSWLKAIELTSRIEADPRRLFADMVEDWSERQSDSPGLISDIETFSYRTLAERINRYARWALSAGIEAGDTVCLLMPSRPDYIAAWLGITRVGGVAALINTKLVGLSLSHCINVAGAIRLGKELGPGHVIVTLLCDSGVRYASKLYNPAFLRSLNLPVPAWLERKGEAPKVFVS